MINTSNDHSVICSDVLAKDSTKQQNNLVTRHPAHKNEDVFCLKH